MARKAKKKVVAGYLDPKYNHKEVSSSIKFTLIQAKRLGLVGKHAGSKPVDTIKNLLRSYNRRNAALTKLKNSLKEQEETAKAE